MKVNFEKITLSKILMFGAILAAVVIAFSIFFSNIESSYEHQIQHWRKEKNSFFKNDNSSPITDKEAFKGLNYFDPDMKFRVEAHIVLLNDSTPFMVTRTDGKKDKYRRYAIATFEMNKKEYQLTLFKTPSKKDSVNEKVLFLPFTDKTTGQLTYHAGRYLDVEQKEKEKDKVIIDFNFAYNPFCAYNQRYSCPLPPKENYLDIEILAGEKIYQKENTDLLIN